MDLLARNRSRLPKNLFGEQVGEGRAEPLSIKRAATSTALPSLSEVFTKGSLFDASFHSLPLDILKKGRDIVRPFQSVVDHEGMFEYVHDQ